MESRIYMDHTATTPLDERVAEAMRPYFSGIFGNASSVHSFGREAKQALEGARATIAAAVGALPGEIFFTSGGTEANNMAIAGCMAAARKHRSSPHLITTAVEHHAVLDPARHLEETGSTVTFLPGLPDGSVEPEQVEHALTEATCLVSVIAANNEVGTVTPLAAIGKICRSAGISFHSDAVQALGKIPVNTDAWHADLLSLSAHKIGGPKGIGALYIRQGTAIEPVMTGGGQERGRRPGTENVPLAVGFARAVEIAVEEMEAEGLRLSALRDRLWEEIRNRVSGATFNGSVENRLPQVLSISLDYTAWPIEGELLVHNMDLEGVAVSSGSACTSGSIQPSHVLLAMGRDPRTARATIRFSLGRANTEDQIGPVVTALERVLARMLRS